VPLRFRIRPPDAAGTPLPVERVVDVEIGTRTAVSIGRRAGSDIELPFATVSGRHAQVVRAGEGWSLVDLGSANGTFVGERRLAPSDPAALVPGSLVRLADVTIFFEGERRASANGRADAGTESTGTLARRLVSDLFGACRPAEVARLLAVGGPAAPQGASLTLLVPGRRYAIGRAPHCDLVLADDDVSREHAVFERRWDGVYVCDLGSKNGVQVRGERIVGESRLRDGDVVAVGATRLRVDDPEDRYLRQMHDQAGSSQGGGTQRGTVRDTLPPAVIGAAGSPSPFGAATALAQAAPAAAAVAAAPAAAPLAGEAAAGSGTGLPDTGTAASLVRTGRGPALLASVAALVLAGIVGLMAWLVTVAR
jgi:pSer/pThr/pTyr-binding forkhead associated (FHA) protein